MLEVKDKTILVVDDEAGLRKVLALDFKRRGFTVVEASNGKEALRTLQEFKVDVLITDVRMPDIDGISLLKKVKDINVEIPIVIFMTGFSDLTSEEAMDLGADALLPKPFDRKDLTAAVFKAIVNRQDQWSARQYERLDYNYQIELYIPELNLSSQGMLVNIGRGGFFVGLSDNYPPIGKAVSFSIKIGKGPLQAIEGDGIVRWVRKQTRGAFLAGCGIEFEFLAEGSRSKVIKLIKTLGRRAFIPKG